MRESARKVSHRMGVNSLKRVPFSDLTQLSRELRAMALKAGASHAGVADLTEMYEVWHESFEKEECGRLLTGISVCVAEDDDLLDALPATDDAYRTSHYSEKIRRAMQIAGCMVKRLEEEGYRAHCVSHPPRNGATGLFKLVAHLAGIGWIGRNRLLVTPERGPRVALAAVLTDAPLPPTAERLMDSRCGDCTDCLDVCPVRAFTTDPFELTDSLVGFSTGRCALNRGTINPTLWGACGLCMKVCPFGLREK